MTRIRNLLNRNHTTQITLLVILNLFVGGMVGLERTVLPLVAQQDFGLYDKSAALSFIISFGIIKAIANVFAGKIADSIGRRRLLILGWIAGIPIPFIVIFAPNWGWVIFANLLLGINQGLCWSMTVNMKIDLAGPNYRGLVVGLNEFAGYFAISLTAFISGYIGSAYGVRPQPFYLGIGFSVVGLLISILLIKDTQNVPKDSTRSSSTSFFQSFLTASWKDRQLFSVSQAGFMTNFKDGMAWGLFPLFFTAKGLDLKSTAIIVAVYPGTWGILQLFSGPFSDLVGRKWLSSLGMVIQGLSILEIAFVHGFIYWIVGAVGLGIGTALVYPVLIAVVSDLSHSELRATILGVYRFWRDFGYAAGALFSGVAADLLGTSSAMLTVGVLVLVSGFVVTFILQESVAAI